MRSHRLLLVVLVGLSLLLGAGCYARIYGPPLLIPVPVPMGGGYYGHPYHDHGYYR